MNKCEKIFLDNLVYFYNVSQSKSQSYVVTSLYPLSIEPPPRPVLLLYGENFLGITFRLVQQNFASPIELFKPEHSRFLV